MHMCPLKGCCFYSRQAKIFTADGALKIQSASNKNVSFAVDDTSDVLFGSLSIKELQQKVCCYFCGGTLRVFI